jgi:hypothetical protein
MGDVKLADDSQTISGNDRIAAALHRHKTRATGRIWQD